MNTPTDIALIQQLRKGNEKALHLLIDRYRMRLYRLAYSLLSDSDAAEDAVQETFIRLWRHAWRFNPKNSVSTWLFTICVRRCYDEMRRRRRHRDALAQLQFDDVKPNELAAEELFALLQQVTSALPPKQRIVYQLREVEGCSAEEVAAATRMSIDQVKANLYVARNTVREKLKQYGI